MTILFKKSVGAKGLSVVRWISLESNTPADAKLLLSQEHCQDRRAVSGRLFQFG